MAGAVQKKGMQNDRLAGQKQSPCRTLRAHLVENQHDGCAKVEILQSKAPAPPPWTRGPVGMAAALSGFVAPSPAGQCAVCQLMASNSSAPCARFPFCFVTQLASCQGAPGELGSGTMPAASKHCNPVAV